MEAIFCSWADLAAELVPEPIHVAVWKITLKPTTMTIEKKLKSLSFDMSYGLMKLSPATRSMTVGMISLDQLNL